MSEDHFFIRMRGQTEFRKAKHGNTLMGGFQLLDCIDPAQNCFVASSEVDEIMCSLGPYIAPETKQAADLYEIRYKQ